MVENYYRIKTFIPIFKYIMHTHKSEGLASSIAFIIEVTSFMRFFLVLSGRLNKRQNCIKPIFRIINLPLERIFWQLTFLFHIPLRLTEISVGCEFDS